MNPHYLFPSSIAILGGWLILSALFLCALGVRHRGRQGFPETPHRVECAWCKKVLSYGGEPVSHGICPECKEAFFRQAEECGIADRFDHNCQPIYGTVREIPPHALLNVTIEGPFEVPPTGIPVKGERS